MNAYQPTVYGEPVLPDAIESEQALLGACIMRNDCLENVPVTFSADHFEEPIHREIYAAMERLHGEGKTFSAITLRSHVPDFTVGNITKQQYLANLAGQVVNYVHVPDWCAAITAASARRDVFALASDLRQIAFEDELKIPDDIAAIRNRLAEVTQSLVGETATFSISDALDRALDTASGRRAVPLGVDPGLSEVMHLTGPWQNGQLIIIGGGVKQGKGQPLDAKILTPFGYRRMGDMKLGSQITAPDGSVSKVIGIFPLGNRQLFDVKFSDGTTTEVTEDHLWLARRSMRTAKRNGQVVTGDDTMKIYTTEQMIKFMETNKRSTFQIPVTKPVPFTSGRPGDRPVHPYLLGVLLGDGCLRKSTPEFTTEDHEIAARVEERTGFSLTFSRSETRCAVYRVSGQPQVRSYLDRSKLHGKLSQDKFIPKQYLYASVEDRLELVRGLMDTDGWAGTEKADAAAFYCTVSERLAEDMAWVLRSLGAVVSIHTKRRFFTHNGEKKEGQLSYNLRIRHPDTATLFSLERKKAKCAAPRYMTKTIVSITPGRMAESQCIQVDHPSSLYITNDFIVTHNTALAMQCMFEIARETPVFLYSGEMTASQIMMRELARRTGISERRQKRKQVSEGEIEKLVMAGADMRRLKHIEIDCRKMTLEKIAQKARAMKKTHGIGAVFIDHIGKIQWEGKMQYEDEFRQGQIATSKLKDLALELDIPVIALTHLKKATFQDYQGRSAVDRLKAVPHRRPSYRDLVGNMDKDADQVLIAFQPRPILAGMEPGEDTSEYVVWQDLMSQWEGKAEIHLVLSRESEFPRRKDVIWTGETTSYGPAYAQAQNRKELF